MNLIYKSMVGYLFYLHITGQQWKIGSRKNDTFRWWNPMCFSLLAKVPFSLSVTPFWHLLQGLQDEPFSLRSKWPPVLCLMLSHPLLGYHCIVWDFSHAILILRPYFPIPFTPPPVSWFIVSFLIFRIVSMNGISIVIGETNFELYSIFNYITSCILYIVLYTKLTCQSHEQMPHLTTLNTFICTI